DGRGTSRRRCRCLGRGTAALRRAATATLSGPVALSTKCPVDQCPTHSASQTRLPFAHHRPDIQYRDYQGVRPRDDGSQRTAAGALLCEESAVEFRRLADLAFIHVSVAPSRRRDLSIPAQRVGSLLPAVVAQRSEKALRHLRRFESP